MKNFLLFAGIDYCPGGGMRDYIGEFDTIDEAKDYMLRSDQTFDWWQIVNSLVMQVVIEDHRV